MNPFLKIMGVDNNQQPQPQQTENNPFIKIMGVDNAPQETTQNMPSDIGKAADYVDNPDMNQHQGMCQQFVEQVTQGHSGIYPSAIDAWNSYSQNGQAVEGTKGLQAGDIVYFSPNTSNEGYGHTGIYTGNGKFVSATDNGVKNENINDWQNSTGQQVLGYVKNPENLPQVGGTK